jgi:bacterioferritin
LHAEGLIERILFLDGSADLSAELAAVKQYNAAARICGEAAGNSSKRLFETMVQDEEQHTDFLETQLALVAEIGLDNYLAQQLHGKE